MNKLPRLKGVKYLRCQHLREGTQEIENGSWYVGDNLRIVVCPLCLKMHLGNIIDYLNQLYVNGSEYYKKMETYENKEEIYNQLFNTKGSST